LSDQVPGDVLGRQAGLFQNLITGGVVQEFVRQTDFVDSRVDPRSSQFLSNSGPDSPDPHPILNADDNPVIASQVNDAFRHRNNPTRVNDGCADSLVGKPVSNIHSKLGHRSDGDNQDILVGCFSEHIDPVWGPAHGIEDR
jgi:hypothetical protein